MRLLAFFVFIVLNFISLSVNAKTYYFSSSSGSDSRTSTQAQSPSTPWKSISKLNSFFSSLQPGDSVLFKRGEVFYGAITISRSGTSSAPIVISAYGSGSKPVITGFTKLSTWTSIGNGVYESYHAALGSAVNMVTVNNRHQPLGRYPNTTAANKGYLSYETYSGYTSITDNTLTSTPNWKGAQVVIRINRWAISKSAISSHSGSTIYYSTPLGTPTKGFGYFIQNDIRTLDQAGEWFHNASTKKLNVFFGSSSPSNYAVQVSTVDNLVYSYNQSYITFNGLALEGSNSSAFEVVHGNNFFILNCDLKYSGINAITLKNATGCKVENSTINYSNSNAIEFAVSSNNCTIRNNKIQNTGLNEGMIENSDKSAIAISSRGDNHVITNNRIDSSGHMGIRFTGANILIKNNYISNFSLIKDDGGGIYTWNTQGSNRRIIGNIIKNGIGAKEGTGRSGGSSSGIYMDDVVTGVEIADNTITSCAKAGIYIHNSYGIAIKNNVLYDNGKQIEFRHDKIEENYPIRKMNIKNNIFFSKEATQNISSYGSIKDDVHLMGSVDSNYYCRPIDDNLVNTTSVVNSSGQSINGIYDLQGWQKAYNLDLRSKKSPKELSLYTINKLVGVNKFANGKFDKDKSGLYTSPSSSWVSSKLDGGTFQATVSATSSYYQVIIAVGSVSAAKNYILKFSAQSTKDTVISVYLRQSSSPHSRISDYKHIKVGPTRKEYKFLYQQPAGESNASIGFDTKGKDFKFWLDNIELYEADVTFHDVDNLVKFEYNATTSSKTIALDAKYIDVKNNSYSGSVTLKPFTSIILMRDGETIQEEKSSQSCNSTGSILREYWSNVSGTSVTSIPLSTAPTSNTQLTSFEAPSKIGDNYGQRIRGYICAPVSGSYTFYIAGDDATELWLSTSDDPANKKRIAYSTGWTYSRDWTKSSSQKSVSITLQGGTKYYIEALHKESSGGDNLAVGWIKPGTSSIVIIPGSVLSPFVVSSSGTTTLPTITCNSSGSILREYWSNVSGTSVTSIPLGTAPSSSSQLTSFEAPSKIGDNYGQRIRGYICAPVSGSYTFYIAGDDVTELWLSTSDDPVNKKRIAYSIGWTYSRDWTNSASQKSVSITLQGGKKYYIEALHKESSGGDNIAVGWIKPGTSSIVVIPGSVLSPFVVSSPILSACTATGSIQREYWSNVSGTSVTSIPLSTTPTSSSQLTSFEAPTKIGDNYGQRIKGYICAPVSGSYTFYIAGDDATELWLSTSDNPANKKRIAYSSGWTSSREWTKSTSQTSVSISLQKGTKYYIEALHKESSGGDNLAVGWVVPGSSNITVIPGSVLSPFVEGSSATGPAENKAPTVNFTSPLTGASFKAPATITVSASAADSDGSISKVEFYNGTTLIATEKTSPYSISWNNVAAGTYTLKVKATDDKGLSTTSSSLSVTVASSLCSATGNILREYWSNVSGTSVTSIPINMAPSSVSHLTSFEAPTNAGNNYAQRIRGYICAPSTGSYTFYIASDDHSELWLSSSDDPTKKQKIAYITSYTASREWTKFTSQKSVSITLQKGSKYYIEAIHNEGYGGDNLAVGWIVPGFSSIAIIPGSVLSPFVTNEIATMRTTSAIQEVLNLNENSTIDQSKSMNIAPNPASSNIKIITTGLPSGQRIDINIYSVSGAEIKYHRFESNSTLLSLNISSLPNGVYYLRLRCGDYIETKKFIKQP